MTATPADTDATGRQATDLAITFLRRGILSGALEPGSRLNAAQIAADLGVTIVPVREAIHFLAGAGLVDLLPLRGARVRNFGADEVIAWWRVFQALTEIELESTALRIAEEPEKTAVINEAMAVIRAQDPAKDPLEFLNSLSDFHLRLNSITGGTVVREASRRLQVRFWTSFLGRYVPLGVYGPEFADHYGLIADALRRGDGGSAIAIFRHHVAWSTALMRGERPQPGAPWHPASR